MVKINSNSKKRSSSSSASSTTKSNGVKDSDKKRKATRISKRKTEKFDAKKPKKPPTAFFYFLEDFRKDFQEQNPNVKSMREIGKACGEKWKTMTYEEKVKYYDIATQKRAVFDKATAEYNKKMESGEFDEIVDDSDFDE
ncbi:high mobility group B protein 14 isoform X1 [Mercurialis annua]|uniref:high mobility group B protein 14 isoform X1 n=1 Tax=Mercurialis annua TaxID=3986 RepID=UPI00215E7421|nr:high mobility group B protein 14 isoform X1 [Mercurialis annua]